jgi:hypothetical protein
MVRCMVARTADDPAHGRLFPTGSPVPYLSPPLLPSRLHTPLSLPLYPLRNTMPSVATILSRESHITPERSSADQQSCVTR